MFPIIHYGLSILGVICAVSCDCGAPGYSEHCSVDKDLLNNNTYPEKYRITYTCHNGILIGYWQRDCESGRWSKTIPKGGKLSTTPYLQ